jgi:hypothetical protein
MNYMVNILIIILTIVGSHIALGINYSMPTQFATAIKTPEIANIIKQFNITKPENIAFLAAVATGNQATVANYLNKNLGLDEASEKVRQAVGAIISKANYPYPEIKKMIQNALYVARDIYE